MKTILAIFIITASYYCHSQTLESDKVDEFTGDKVQKTSFETLVQSLKMNAFVSATNINDSSVFIDLKLMLGSGRVHAIDKGGIFFLKLSDNSIIELRNIEYSISCTGCGARGLPGSGAQGTKTSYVIDKSQLQKLRSTGISKIRIYTTDGYVESEVKPNKSDTVRGILNLLTI